MWAQLLIFVRSRNIAEATIFFRGVIHSQRECAGGRLVHTQRLRSWPIPHILMPSKNRIFLPWSFVQQLIVVLCHIKLWKELPRNTGRQAFINIPTKRWQVSRWEHDVDDAPLLEWNAKGLRHVAVILPRDVDLPIQEPIKRMLNVGDLLLRQHVIKGCAAVTMEAFNLFWRQDVLVGRNSTKGATGSRAIAQNDQTSDKNPCDEGEAIGRHVVWIDNNCGL